MGSECQFASWTLWWRSGGSAQSTGDSLVTSMDRRVQHRVVMNGVKDEILSEGKFLSEGEIKKEAQEETGEVTPGPRPLLMPVLEIKPERDWNTDVWAAYMETKDVLSHPALPGRSDETKNNITLYKSEEIGTGVRWEDYHEEQKAILRVAQVLNMKKEIKNDSLYQVGNNAFLPIYQSINQSRIVNLMDMMGTGRRSPNTERGRKVVRNPCVGVAGPARGWLSGPVHVSTYVKKQRRRMDTKEVKTEPSQFIEGSWTAEDSLRLQESIQRELYRLHNIKVQDKESL